MLLSDIVVISSVLKETFFLVAIKHFFNDTKHFSWFDVSHFQQEHVSISILSF